MSEYPINSRVSVYISHYSQAGLLGKVENGPRAIVRRREISWNHSQPFDDYVNQFWQAIVLHYDSVQEQLELSLRLVERDPWKEASIKYTLGKEVVGRVTELIEGAAFVELEPGVDAYLSVKELPFDTQYKIEDLVWIQDYIRSTVEEVLPYQRRIRLSAKSLLARSENQIRHHLWISNPAFTNKHTTLEELRQQESQRHVSELNISSSEAYLSKPERDTFSPIQGYQENLQTAISQLELKVQATTVAIMRLDPGRPNPVLEVFSGKPISLEDASPDIIYSPLEDVLLKGLVVWLESSNGSTRLDRLQSLLSFQGFMGIPVPTSESSRYGLFLFKENGNFTQQNYQQSNITTYLISQIIHERRLIRIFHPWQSQNLIGQLSSSIIHEVNNKLGGIELLTQHLRDGIREMARSPEKAEDATFLRGLEEDVDGITRAQKAASELRNWYLGLTATDEQKPVSLKKLAQEMIRALRSQAQESNVILDLKSPKQLPLINARPSQLRQIFVNLRLNSIQQMAGAKRTGKMTIVISYLERLPLPIRVRFKDEGPGIHFQLWENIFDFGFTTRNGGAGLGLTVSRQAVIQLKGQLRVEESEIFGGTTFLLELPIGE